MNRLNRLVLAALLLLLLPVKALATCNPVFTYQLANGQVADATQVMSNFNQAMGCATSVDNTQIGTLGIFASQLKPTTIGQATFGGTLAYTFSNQLLIDSSNDAVIPAIIKGNSVTQSVSLLQIFRSNADTEIFDVGQVGNVTVQTAADSAIGMIVDGAPDNGQTGDLFRAFIKSGGTQVAALAAGGDLQVAPLINSLHTLTRVPPVYTVGGAQVAATEHIVSGVIPATDFTSCNGATGCNIGVALTGPAQFAVGGDCWLTGGGAYTASKDIPQPTSGNTTSAGIAFNAVQGQTLAGFTNNETFHIMCIGA